MDFKYSIAATENEVGVLLGHKNAVHASMRASFLNVFHCMGKCCVLRSIETIAQERYNSLKDWKIDKRVSS